MLKPNISCHTWTAQKATRLAYFVRALFLTRVPAFECWKTQNHCSPCTPVKNTAAAPKRTMSFTDLGGVRSSQ